jgi:hypothetical protein
MDIREVVYWEAKAARKILFDRLSAVQAARFAMADDESYRIEMMRIEWSLKLLDKSMEGDDGRGVQSWLHNR